MYPYVILASALVVCLLLGGFFLLVGRSKRAAPAGTPAAPAGTPEHASAMVIVEPRKHKHMRHVVENFDANMPPEYDLYVFHGKSAEAFVRDATSGVRRRRVHLRPLDTDNMTADQYNAFFKDPAAFWGRIDAENILIFQTDAVLCGRSRQSIRDFEQLGYIGCAYDARAGAGTHWGKDAFWGVGGLSFRKKSAALACLARLKAPDTTTPEDVFFSNCVEAGHGLKPRDGLQLSSFCSQNNFIAHSFGAHRIHDMMAKDQLAEFLQYCPEAKPLVDDP